MDPALRQQPGHGRHREGVYVVVESTAGPVAGRDDPADTAQLRAWFPSDGACLDYLDWLRWPDGFDCPHCGSDAAGREAMGRYRCHGCRKQISVTSGTIFHRTRTPLTVWFEVAWLITANKSAVSASHLHRVLPVSSYQTAWTMLGKLRQVMTTAQSEPLTGRVEVDETFLCKPPIRPSRPPANAESFAICSGD